MRRAFIVSILVLLCDSIVAEPETHTSRIRIRSEPAGADIFVDGVFAGRTPLEIETKGKAANVRLSAAGFEDLSFPVQSSGDAELEFRLTPRIQEPKADGPYWEAFARSMILPGWGQHFKGDTSAFCFATGTVLAIGASA